MEPAAAGNIKEDDENIHNYISYNATSPASLRLAKTSNSEALLRNPEINVSLQSYLEVKFSPWNLKPEGLEG